MGADIETIFDLMKDDKEKELTFKEIVERLERKFGITTNERVQEKFSEYSMKLFIESIYRD